MCLPRRCDSEEKRNGYGIRRSEGNPDILKEGEWHRHRKLSIKIRAERCQRTAQFV